MYVYQRTESQLWTVGYYDTRQKWIAESDHDTPDEAAERTAWLNGGTEYSSLAVHKMVVGLRAALVDAQSVASEQCRLRAEVEGKLTEATTLLEHSDKRINELEAIVYRQAELLDEKGYTQQEAMLRFQQKRITELEQQLATTLIDIVQYAFDDGALYAEGCKP